MTHIFTEEAEVSSEDSLSAAVAKAFQSALKACVQDGDHAMSLTVVIEGYHFDGKNYTVKLRVIVFDHELAKEELYEELEKEYRQRFQEEQKLMDHMHAAFYARPAYHHDHVTEALEHSAENYGSLDHIDNVTFIAPQPFHDQMSREMGVDPDAKPAAPKPHVDIAEPALGPGSGGSHGDEGKQAA